MNLQSMLVVLLLLAAVSLAAIRLYKKHKTKRGCCDDCDATGCIFRNVRLNKKK